MTVKDLKKAIDKLPDNTVVKVWNTITDDCYADAEEIIVDPEDTRLNIVISDIAGD